VVSRDCFGHPGVPLLIPGLHCLQVLTGSVSACTTSLRFRDVKKRISATKYPAYIPYIPYMRRIQRT
jgi:hypothetical protein